MYPAEKIVISRPMPVTTASMTAVSGSIQKPNWALNVPAVNQVELHPAFPQHALHAFHQAHNIVTEAWSPLAQGALDAPVIKALAEKHDRTAAQVVLRWHMQRGIVAIPKSVTPSRIAENIAVFDFALDDEDMERMRTLDTGIRIGPDPDRF